MSGVEIRPITDNLFGDNGLSNSNTLLDFDLKTSEFWIRNKTGLWESFNFLEK